MLRVDVAGPSLVALVAAAMLVGLAGVVVPVLPGLSLVWGATLVWALLTDGSVRWVVLAVATVWLAVGTAASYVLPARTAGRLGAPRRSLLVAAAGAVAGLVLVPVVGVLVGGLGGLLLAEYHRLRAWPPAWRTTTATLRALGLGILVELAAALSIIATWLVGVLAS